MGSFTQAALTMGVAQPMLSRQIRQLEVELHQSLLIRNGRGVTPTESGLLMLEHARGILYQVALAKEELSGTSGALAGPISIGLPPSLSRLITVPLTLAFKMPCRKPSCPSRKASRHSCMKVLEPHASIWLCCTTPPHPRTWTCSNCTKMR